MSKAAYAEEEQESLLDHSASARAIVEAALDAVVTVDARGRILEFNPAAEVMFGHARSAVLGRRMSTLLIPPSLRSAHELAFERIVRTGEATVLGRRLHLHALRADSGEFPVELTVTRIASEDGGLYTAFLRDLTELRTAERYVAAQQGVSEVLARGEPLEQTYPAALRAVGERLDWEFGAVWEPGAAAGALSCTATWHRESSEFPLFQRLTHELRLRPGVGLPGRVWTTGRCAWLEDVTVDPNFPRSKAALANGLHGAIALPLSVGERLVGVMEWFSTSLRPPDGPLLELLSLIGRQVAEFVERKRAEAERDAYRDHLEELVRERTSRLEEAQRELVRAERMAALGDLTAIVAHELRNPLGTIRTSSTTAARASCTCGGWSCARGSTT